MDAIKNQFKRMGSWCKGYFSITKGTNPVFIDSIRFYVVFSVILEFVVESLCRRSVFEALKFLFLSPYAFMFSALIILLTLSISMFFPFKVAFFTLISLIWIGFGLTDCIMHSFRVTPFNVGDLELLTSVSRIFKVYMNFWQIFGICALLIVAFAGVVFLFIKIPLYKIKIVKAVCLTLVVAVLLLSTFFIGTSTSLLATSFPNLVDAYNDFGFPYCFMISMIDRGVDQPSHYDDASMQEIIDKLSNVKTNQVDKTPNVIVVQLESFFNVNNLVNLEYSQNPIKYFDELKSKYPSGKITVPSIGAGTVNTEFEVLSGMSLSYFGAGEYPYKTVLNDYTCETIAYNLMELGYRTHAIHNYEGTFYNRNEVYKQLGFETFTSMEYMKKLEYNAAGTWPMDSILTDEILSAMSSTTENDFVFAVSVQAHGKYPPSQLADDYVPTIEVSFVDETVESSMAELDAWEYYINQIAQVDLFVKELSDAVMALEEDTVLVFYGDHLPSLMISDTDLENSTRFETEYLIVDNFSDEQNKEYGDLFAYQLSACVLSHVGINNGILTKFHQNYMSADFYQEWLNRLQYDMLGNNGQRYVYGGDFSYYKRMDEMRMGIDDIVITDYKYENGILYVYGENFTTWSCIVADNKAYTDTIFITSELLVVNLPKFDEVEIFSVDQISDDGIHLSSSNLIEIPRQ